MVVGACGKMQGRGSGESGPVLNGNGAGLQPPTQAAACTETVEAQPRGRSADHCSAILAPVDTNQLRAMKGS